LNIIINVSNLHIGGGVQVAISFVNELKKITNANFYHIVLSETVNTHIEHDFPKNKFKFYVICQSSVRLLNRLSQIKKLRTIERKIQPDVVFSLFGPSYWRPKSLHVMGFADPWILNPASKAYDELSLMARVRMRLQCFIKSYYLMKDSNHYIIETQDGKNKMVDLFNIERDRIFVVGNCFNGFFYDSSLLETSSIDYLQLPARQKDEFRLLLITHNYPHKNLQIIKKVIPLLKDYNVKFVLTIDHKSFGDLFGISSNDILNLGPVSIKSCPSLYEQCDALFMPSLLEVFSASYLEAMKMSKPILASNLSFAKEVCEDAALYFDPLDDKDISKKIIKLIEDDELISKLINKGIRRLDAFETAQSRAKKYLDILSILV
tara:strand:- start:1212 stop:2342 length:1131 start_codon:yes stop_codon:yes gene_type:complete